jgi:hypothetical protein
MTSTTGLAPVVDKMDRRAALVLGAAAASVLAGGADASAQGAAGAVKSYNPVTVATPLGPYSHLCSRDVAGRGGGDSANEPRRGKWSGL